MEEPLQISSSLINNGMYALSLKEGKGAANLDSDDNNEVIGQVVCDDEMEKVDEDVQEVTKHSLASWNPFDSDNAPEGYIFFGKLSFLCLGPASDFFSETLLSTGRQVTSVEDKKSMECCSQQRLVLESWPKMKMMQSSVITTCVGRLLQK